MLFTIVVPIVHVVACLFLIVVVLLQTGKGADMGAVFGGGGSQTLFGSTGAGNLLTKLTTAMAVTFMLTSLTLGLGQRERPGSSLLERLPETAAPVPAPADTPLEDAAPAEGAALPEDAAPLEAPAATEPAPPVADAAPNAEAGSPTDQPPPAPAEAPVADVDPPATDAGGTADVAP